MSDYLLDFNQRRLASEYAEHHGVDDDVAYEVIFLRCDNQEVGDANQRLSIEITHLRARVEELELNQHYYPKTAPYEHIITEEQVDAAWEGLHRDVAWGESERRLHDDYRAVVKAYFSKLGIVACKECGGSRDELGKVWGTDVPCPIGECPACHGHGWVWKEASDE